MRAKLVTVLTVGVIGFLLATNPVVSDAAGQVTGKQIKNSSITGKDVRNHSLTAADVSGSVAGPAGATGAAGPAGPRGAAGTDATDAVPSGRTITGVYYEVDSPDSVLTLPLPMRLAGPVATAEVNFAADSSTVTTDDDASCTGSYTNPTAPAGTFCIYGEFFNGVSAASGYSFDDTELQDRGIFLSLNLSAASATYYGSWAYTAP